MADDIAASSAAPASTGNSASGSSGSDSAVGSAASPTAAPAGGTTVEPNGGTAPNPNGEPPRERWDSILSNARSKARSEAEAEYKQKFQPYEQFERDPWQAVQSWLQQAEGHSLYGDKVKAYYQSRQQSQQPAAEPAPDVPIVDENGRITGKTYSADALKEWQRWNATQERAEYDKRLGPIEQHFKQQQQREQQQHLQQRAQQEAGQTLGQLRQLPYFKEHEADIRQALAEHEEWGSNVHQAFNHVLMTKILPTLSSAEQKSVLNTLQQQGSATTVAPSGTAVGTPKFKSYGSAMRYYAEHPDEAAAMANRR